MLAPNINCGILMFNLFCRAGEADINEAPIDIKVAFGKQVFAYADAYPEYRDDYIYDACLVDHGFLMNSKSARALANGSIAGEIIPTWTWEKFEHWRKNMCWAEGHTRKP